MTDIKTFLEFHLSGIGTVNDVARQLNVSPETLRKAFRRQYDLSLGEYILRLKVEVMKEYLLIGNDPCNWICYSLKLREDSGAKLFKRITGETMQQFREKHKKNGIANVQELKTIKKSIKKEIAKTHQQKEI